MFGMKRQIADGRRENRNQNNTNQSHISLMGLYFSYKSSLAEVSWNTFLNNYHTQD